VIPPHTQRVIDGLKAHGLAFVDVRRVDGFPFTFAIFADVKGHGSACPEGTIPRLAIPIPDDIQTPPPGFHMHPPLGLGTVKNTSESPLSTVEEKWCYWSRPLPNWARDSTAARIVSHLQSVLRDA
jgi:hypothetical protein